MATYNLTAAQLRAGGILNSFEMPAVGSFSNIYSTEYDGVDQYITLSTSTTHSDNLSISLWIKGSSSALENLVGGTGIFTYFGSLWSGFYINNGGWKNMMSAGFFDGTWKHAVITIENNSTVKGYENGVLKSTYTFTGITNNTISKIGRFGSSGIRYYTGQLDEVALFNTVLSASDVSDIYNSGVPNDLSGYSSLTNWWRFEEGSGTTAIDSKGSNNGTLINGVTYSTNVP